MIINKPTLRLPLLCLLLAIVMMFAGCSKTQTIELENDEIGFQLLYHIGDEEESLINGLQSQDADLQLLTNREYFSVEHHIYGITEDVQGIPYLTTLEFVNYPDEKKFILSEVRVNADFDHWPVGEEADTLETVFQDLLQRFGEPSEKQYIFEDNVLFDGYQMPKLAIWEPYICHFSMMYDHSTKATEVCIYTSDSPYYQEIYPKEIASLKPGDPLP